MKKNYAEIFDREGYVHLQNFLDIENCSQLTTEMKKLVDSGQTHNDEQCPKSQAIHGAPIFDELLEKLLPYFEVASGKKLLPTYAYARLYAPGDELKFHRDRPACEISATVTLGFEGDVWPIYMAKQAKADEEGAVKGEKFENDIEYYKDRTEVKMDVGDAVLYRGQDIWHWRDKYTQGKWQAQVFLHYVDANGPNAEWKYDKRPRLSHHADNALRNMDFVVYEDVLTSQACDIIIKTYEQEFVKKEEGRIGGSDLLGVVEKSIRNVQKVILPVHKDIGGRLAAVGLDANIKNWKFDITHANQSEFLKYPKEGRYKGHVDTFMNPNAECRKLTVLAFLNDDFKGGKFYLQTSHEKIYPPQKKGTVLVFPSFMLHGVEDIEEGTRYSTVCWMVGPWFK